MQHVRWGRGGKQECPNPEQRPAVAGDALKNRRGLPGLKPFEMKTAVDVDDFAGAKGQ